MLPSDRGPILPERCIIYDRPLLTFGHHWSSPHRQPPQDGPDRLQSHVIAGLEKTARRFFAILDRFSWAQPTIVDLPTPERILFHTLEPDLFYDLVLLEDTLVQSESLSLSLSNPNSPLLLFQRC